MYVMYVLVMTTVITTHLIHVSLISFCLSRLESTPRLVISPRAHIFNFFSTNIAFIYPLSPRCLGRYISTAALAFLISIPLSPTKCTT